MNVSKKILALLMAMLMAFSCMAVSASAEGEEAGTGTESTETTEVNVSELILGGKDLELTLDKDDKTITTNVLKDSTVTYNEVEYELEVSIEPSEGVYKSYTEDDYCVFSQLAYGTEYTVTVAVVDDVEDDVTVTGSKTAKEKLLKEMTAPAAPVPFEITSKSIKITAVKGYLYSVTTVDGTVVYDWAKSEAEAIEYDKLDAETSYIISVKIPENDTYYESKATSITVKTKLAAKDGTPAIALEDKTDSSITVAKLEGVEYSLDGKAWQASNVFSGLKSDTQYSIVARYTFDAAKQDPSAISEALVVKTNAKANYEAKEKNIVFTAEDGQYANGEIKFTVKGDGPANMSEATYGDTRIMPDTYTVVFGSETIKEATVWDTAKVSQNGSFTAPGYEEKVVTVKVKFITEEFKGSGWVYVSETVKSYDITIGRTGDSGTKILEFFEGILNFLLNTVPAFFAEALKSDVWARLFEAIGNIGKAMG